MGTVETIEIVDGLNGIDEGQEVAVHLEVGEVTAEVFLPILTTGNTILDDAAEAEVEVGAAAGIMGGEGGGRYDNSHSFGRSARRNSDESGQWNQSKVEPLDQKEPQQQIVIQYLPSAVTEEVLQQELDKLQACVDSVRIIKDRKTGMSRGFAFVKFISIEHARWFMEANYPQIMVSGTRVRIDYSRNSSQDDNDDWMCKMCGVVNFKRRSSCFQCKGMRDDSFSTAKDKFVPMAVNDGRNDIGDKPSNLLLAIGLDPVTSEETLYNAMMQLAPVKEVRIVKDRSTHLSWGFGFIEFPDVETATYVLSLMFAEPPLDLVIDNRKISLSYAKVSSFTPVYVSSPWVSTSYKDPSGLTVYLAYWDQQAYATAYPMIATNAATAHTSANSNSSSLSNRRKSQPVSNQSVATKSEFQAHAGAKMTTQLQSIYSAASTIAKEPQKKSLDDELAAFYDDVESVAEAAKAKRRSQEEELAAFYSEMDSSAPLIVEPVTTKDSGIHPDRLMALQRAEREISDPPPKAHRSSYNREDIIEPPTDRKRSHDVEDRKEKPSVVAATKKMSKHMENWQERQAEFDESGPNPASTVEDMSEEALIKNLPSEEAINDEKTDLNLMACLLCERQFKSVEDLRKHQSKSSLHKTNMVAYREMKLDELKKSLSTEAGQQQYRNRAEERRKMYGQPRHIKQEKNWVPYPIPSSSKTSKNRIAAYESMAERSYDDRVPLVVEQPTKEGIGEENIGNKMLQKLGWKEGTGLGARGNGIVAPIKAESSVKGAGLGSLQPDSWQRFFQQQ
ncbi:hypothetical protein HDU76_006571 [Blyttiomyces sp. JEL0837]|nr:hypothetical protein HDU76_006571 [Blyttiomyces sp. JEL0837]